MADKPVATRLKEAEIARALQEADNHSAQAIAHLAQAETLKAEAAQRRAEAKDSAASAAQTMLETKDFEIDFRQKQRLEREVLALDSTHHTYRLTGPITTSQESGLEMFGIQSPDTVTPAIDRLNFWLRTAERQLIINFVINSPGGELMPAMELFDKILEVRAEGHTVITHARGLAASAAAFLLQAGTIRASGPNAFQIIHEPSTGVHGKVGVIRDELKFIERVGQRLRNIYVTRSQDCAPPNPLTDEYFEEQWRDHDWSLDAMEAYDLGIIDKISGEAPAVTERRKRK